MQLSMPARCRSRTGFVDHVVVTDISRGGCRIESCALTMREGDLVVIQPQVLEGLCGKIAWVKGHKAGIAFATPLYGPVVEHLHREYGEFLPARSLATATGLKLAA
jgi:hypothetical protein